MPLPKGQQAWRKHHMQHASTPQSIVANLPVEELPMDSKELMAPLPSVSYSIVTVTRNNRSGLQKTVESVISQTFNTYEFVIIDGDSYDGTKHYLKLLGDHHIHWVSEPDRSIYDAMNKGIKQSRGTWVLFLNAGDCLASCKVLESLQPYLRPSLAVVYGDYAVDGFPHKARPFSYIERWGLMTSHQSILFNRLVCGDLFHYNCNLRLSADFDLVWRIRRKFPNGFSYSDQVIASVHSGGISTQNFTRLRAEQLLTITRHFGLRGAINYLYEAFRKSLNRFLHRAKDR